MPGWFPDSWVHLVLDAGEGDEPKRGHHDADRGLLASPHGPPRLEGADGGGRGSTPAQCCTGLANCNNMRHSCRSSDSEVWSCHGLTDTG